MAKIRCQYCGNEVEEKYSFWCPDHGQFHNDGGMGICGKFRKRCDGITQICCPVCGFMPCQVCHGRGRYREFYYEFEQICLYCRGTGKRPFELRKIAESEFTSRKSHSEEMYLEAKEFALKSGIRYLYIVEVRNDSVTLMDIRFPGYSLSLCSFDKNYCRKFYGWLNAFPKGKKWRLTKSWQKLLT